MIPIEHLEPFSDGTACSTQTSCRTCLSDLFCAWCPATGTCSNRFADVTCPESDQLVVVDAEMCSACQDRIGCPDCLEVSSKQSLFWMVYVSNVCLFVQSFECEYRTAVLHSRCQLRGLGLTSSTNSTDCAAPCYQ